MLTLRPNVLTDGACAPIVPAATRNKIDPASLSNSMNATDMPDHNVDSRENLFGKSSNTILDAAACFPALITKLNSITRAKAIRMPLTKDLGYTLTLAGANVSKDGGVSRLLTCALAVSMALR